MYFGRSADLGRELTAMGGMQVRNTSLSPDRFGSDDIAKEPTELICTPDCSSPEADENGKPMQGKGLHPSTGTPRSLADLRI